MLTCAADTPNYDVAPGVSAALRNFELPDKLGFGLVAAPVMFSAEWSNGAWGRGELLPYGAIQILPGAQFHHLSLHGDCQSGGDLFIGTDAGGDRAR
jgi:hypothetical protein